MSGRPGSLGVLDDGVVVQHDTHTVDLIGSGFTVAQAVPDGGRVSVSLSAAVNAAGYRVGFQKDAQDATPGTATGEQPLPASINNTGVDRTIDVANSFFLPRDAGPVEAGAAGDNLVITLAHRTTAGGPAIDIATLTRSRATGAWVAFVGQAFVATGTPTVPVGSYVTWRVAKNGTGLTLVVGVLSLSFT